MFSDPETNGEQEMLDSEAVKLFGLDLFQGLTDSQRANIRPSIHRVVLDQGQNLFQQGIPATEFYYVIQGWVVVSRLHESGAATVLHVFGEGESFAEVAALAFADYPASADAATDAIVLSIPAVSYQALIEQDAKFAMQVISSLAHRMRMLIREFEMSQHESGTNRLASFLLHLTSRVTTESTEYILPFSKQMLAARLHMQPETLSRAFSVLRKIGIETTRDGHVLIPDIDKLNDLIDS